MFAVPITVDLYGNGKRKQGTGYFHIIKWLYLDVRTSTSKCISAIYSHSTIADDISIECTSHKGIDGKKLPFL